MNSGTTRRHTLRFPRLLLEDHLTLAGLSWAGLVIFGALLVIGVAFFRDIVISGWDVASGIIPWYTAYIGGYVLHTMLPLHIAHGRTRRDFSIEAVIFAGVFVTVAALLATVGYALEGGLYAVAGWSRDAPDDHLFTSYTDYGVIFAEYWLTVLVWTTAGAFVGAAIYHFKDSGWLTLVPALGMVAISGLARAESGQPMGFILNRLPDTGSASLALTALLSLISFLIAIGLTWLTVREIPLRNR